MGLWPSCTSDINPSDFYLCSTLNSQVNSNDPSTEDDLKESIQSTVLSVSAAEIQGAVNNMLRDVTSVCVLANGKHFQHLLEIQ